MANVTTIQAKINKGYGRAADKLGSPMAVYRPQDSTDPIVPANLISTLPVYFDPDFTFKGSKPQTFAHPIWGAAFDRTSTQPGDYLVGDGTYYIASQQSLLPTACIRCGHVLSLERPGTTSDPNPYYQTPSQTMPAPLAANFPACMLQGTKGEKGDENLPDDVRAPWVAVYLPLIPGQTIQNDDVLIDQDGTRYVVSSAELTEMGWRLTAEREAA